MIQMFDMNAPQPSCVNSQLRSPYPWAVATGTALRSSVSKTESENLFASLFLPSKRELYSRIVRGSRVDVVHTMPICIECGNPVHSGQIEIAQCQAPIIGHKVIIACPVLVRDVGSLELRGDAFVLLGKGASCWRRRGAAEQS